MPTRRSPAGKRARPSPRKGPKAAPARLPLPQTRDSIRDVWGPRAPYAGAWPARVDEHVEAEPERWVQSCCVLCSNGTFTNADHTVHLSRKAVEPPDEARP